MIVLDRGDPVLDCDVNATATSRNNKLFDNLYRKEEIVHAGAYGTVWKVTTRTTQTTPDQQPNSKKKTYAAKIISKEKLRPKDKDAILREVAILRDLSNVKHVVKLVDFLQDDKAFYIVQEFALGGDLFDRIASGDLYSEKEARTLATLLLHTLKEIHKRKVVHLDLKPENILFPRANDKTSVLLADFGFATYLPKEGFLTRRCGTPNYIAPEVWSKQPYNQSSDLFSLGCTIFTCISGLPPFYSSDMEQSFDKICRGDFEFRSIHWNTVSVPAKEFLMGLLTVDPEQRWTAEQALQSTWIQEGLTDALFSAIDWRTAPVSASARCNHNNNNMGGDFLVQPSWIYNIRAEDLG